MTVKLAAELAVPSLPPPYKTYIPLFLTLFLYLSYASIAL